jgi:phosphoribosylformylglycinamidine synthase
VVHRLKFRRKSEIRNPKYCLLDFIALESGPGTIHSAGMKAKVTVMPKKSVLDPQGVAVRDAMRHHGLPEVKSVRIGKFMEIDVDNADESKLHEICRDLLSNPVIEDYELQVEP